MKHETMKKEKKQKGPVRWLLQIVINAVISVVIVMCGFWFDSMLFSNPPEDVQGHGMPVFSLLLFFAALAFFVISTIVCIIMVIAASKRRKAEEPEF